MSKDNEQNRQSPQARPAARRSGDAGTGAAPRVIDSTELFAGHSELTIVHAQENYRLRITRNDKLILTK